MNYFEACGILGIEAETHYLEAQKIYRLLVKQHHPDKGGNTEDFRKIHGAWEYVRNKLEKGLPYDIYTGQFRRVTLFRSRHDENLYIRLANRVHKKGNYKEPSFVNYRMVKEGVFEFEFTDVEYKHMILEQEDQVLKHGLNCEVIVYPYLCKRDDIEPWEYYWTG